MPIYYRKIDKYKYALTADYSVQTPFRTAVDIDLEYISLTKTGLLTLRKGYACDGPSGPAIDTKNFMRGAFVHDALYQLMRMGLLPMTCKDAADRLLQAICIEDGMWKIRAWWVYQGVHRFGYGSAEVEKRSTAARSSITAKVLRNSFLPSLRVLQSPSLRVLQSLKMSGKT